MRHSPDVTSVLDLPQTSAHVRHELSNVELHVVNLIAKVENDVDSSLNGITIQVSAFTSENVSSLYRRIYI